MGENDKRNPRFIFFLGGIFAAGAWLRLHELSSQILLDDEWLGLTAVIGKSFFQVLTEFNPVDNSSLPFNVYDFALLHGLGWSEFTVRLPVIVAGLASLVVLPLLVKKVFNERVALIFACLLAIAPFLIFYSRYARAYGFAALFCFSALLFFQLWLTTGKPRYGAGYVMAGALAMSVHLFSIFAVFVPLGTAMGIQLLRRFKAADALRRQIILPLRHLLLAACLLTALLVPLCWPVLRERAKLPWARGTMTLEAVWNAATLLSGTANMALNVLFYLLFVAGLKRLFKQNPLLGWTCLSAVGAYPIVLLASRPMGLGTGAVILRYMIVVVPMALTVVALALDGLIARAQEIPGMRRSLPSLGVGSFILSLWAAGPLPGLYGSPNNFANHSAFQYSYKHSTWETAEANSVYPSLHVKQEQIPHFYHWLRGQSNVTAIVEYPLDNCDYNDLLYYYQHFHQKRVFAGYCRDARLLGYRLAETPGQPAPRVEIGRLCADEVFASVADQSKLGFRNMVDVLDTAALWRSGADYLILHKYVMCLNIMRSGSEVVPVFGRIPVYSRSVDLLAVRFKETLGTPMYEDGEIVCFQIKGGKH